jgi:hypothetical protein
MSANLFSQTGKSLSLAGKRCSSTFILVDIFATTELDHHGFNIVTLGQFELTCSPLLYVTALNIRISMELPMDFSPVYDDSPEIEVMSDVHSQHSPNTSVPNQQVMDDQFSHPDTSIGSAASATTTTTSGQVTENVSAVPAAVTNDNKHPFQDVYDQVSILS